MKNFIKRLFDKIIDLIFIPFELLINFVKNAESILIKSLRILLIIIIVFIIYFIFAFKPINFVLKGFRMQKYNTAEKAKEGFLKELPLQKTDINEIIEKLSYNNIKCDSGKDKKGSYYFCIGYKNKIFKKEKWTILLRIGTNKTKAVSVKMNIEKINNDFQDLYYNFINLFKFKDNKKSTEKQ